MRIYLLIISLLLWCPGIAQSIQGTWHGTLDAKGHKLRLVIHIEGDSATLDSPDQSAMGIPLHIDYNANGTLRVSVPKIMAMYNAKLRGDTLRGKFKQGLSTIPLDMTRGHIVRNRPQTPKPTSDYTTKTLTFDSAVDGATLTGTLTLTADAEHSPLVLLVSGSGQQNRDSEVFGHKPFAVIADYFARHGISTFRYDDRGIGASGGLNDSLTHYVEADDARSALRMLRSQQPALRYGILGHSLGGMMAYMIGGEHPEEVDFIISMAGTSVRGDTIMIRQMMDAYPTATREQCEAQVLANAETGPWHQWVKAFGQYDPAQAISNIICPVMAINGSKDTQVDADLNLGTLRKYLVIKPIDQIKVYPGLNHLMQHCTTGAVAEYEQIEETISPQVLADMADWILHL